MLTMKTAGLTDLGRVRKNNEDAFAVHDNLLVVADGMGGAAAGEIASSIAVKMITNDLKNILYTSDDDITDAVKRSILNADKEIKTQTEKNAEYRGMGTTIVIALYFGDRLLISHVGDSRAYLISNSSVGTTDSPLPKSQSVDATIQTVILPKISLDTPKNTNSIRRITDDHSVVMELVHAQVITEDEIRSHPLRNRITRCIGSLGNLEPDFTWVSLRNNDALIMCSDGLWEPVHEDFILAIVGSSKNSEEICQRLVTAANDSGGYDNVTVITALFSENK